MKQEYFYFKCNTVHGELLISIEANAKTVQDRIDAEIDMKTKVLYAGETFEYLPRKPRGLVWEGFRGISWARAGFKA
jgi:hypothetical protein